MGLADLAPVGPLDISDQLVDDVPEVATLRVFFHFTTTSHKATLPDEGDYRDQRWVDRMRTLNDLTFTSGEDRDVARRLLKSLTEQNT